jgi:hypothetical protein
MATSPYHITMSSLEAQSLDPSTSQRSRRLGRRSYNHAPVSGRKRWATRRPIRFDWYADFVHAYPYENDAYSR